MAESWRRSERVTRKWSRCEIMGPWTAQRATWGGRGSAPSPKPVQRGRFFNEPLNRRPNWPD